MALGEPLPRQVFGHGWLVLEGGKMSKSKGNVVDPVVLVNKYGLDAIRYFLLREVPFGADGVFSNEALINRINSDLANDLGNLVSRTVAMIDRYFGGVIPEERTEGEFDDELKETVLAAPGKVETLLDRLEFSSALTEIWKAISRANKYIDETTPWILGRDDSKKARLAAIMYNLAESIRIISILIQPFMPETPDIIREQLGIDNGFCSSWECAARWGLYPKGAKVKKGGIIFPRIDVEKELKELEKLTHRGNKADTGREKECKDKEMPGEITIEDFKKIDMRVAKVIEVEKIAGADKLLKLILEVGGETRQVVSGIAEYYAPQDLVGKYVILLANLKPVKLRGVESQGMILAAENGKDLALLTTDCGIATGSRIT
jgi:methionyl-tRNA synthetase